MAAPKKKRTGGHRATKGGKAVGTLMIDRVYPHPVGRIKRASGTTLAPVLARILGSFDTLAESGRLDLLVSVRDGRLKPLDVHAAVRDGKLHALPTAEMLAPLAPAWEAWRAATDCGDGHRATHANALARLLEQAADPDAARVADVPALLAAYRVVAALATHARGFNLVKNSAQVFVRETLKRSHPLYAALLDVDLLPVRAKLKNRPLAVAEFDRLRDRMADSVEPAYFGAQSDAEREVRATEAGSLLCAMCLTGMHWKELAGAWEVTAAGVAIHGTKRASRDRVVPRVAVVYARPALLTEKAFAQRLETASEALFGAEGRRTVYDLRRTFAVWMEAAGIPRTRRRQYLGHAAGDVTEKYERAEVAAYLAADAQRLRDYLNAERGASKEAPRPINEPVRELGE